MVSRTRLSFLFDHKIILNFVKCGFMHKICCVGRESHVSVSMVNYRIAYVSRIFFLRSIDMLADKITEF
jgi:hypothetical protein